MGFWRQHGADHAVLQTDLERYVLHTANVRVDPRTCRSVLYQLRKRGIIRFAELPGGNVLCRLATLAVDPLWPRYDPNVDERLTNPFTYVDCDGRFFRVGSPNKRAPFVHRLRTVQPYFGPFTWARSWLHAYAQGILDYPPAGLPAVTQAARRAVLGYVWACCAAPSESMFSFRVAEAFEKTRARRKVRLEHHFGATCPNDDCSVGLAAPIALSALECAARPAESGAPRLASLRPIYEDLDLLIFSSLRLPALNNVRDYVRTKAEGGVIGTVQFRKNKPTIRGVERRRQIDGPDLLQTLSQWERAWGAQIFGS